MPIFHMPKNQFSKIIACKKGWVQFQDLSIDLCVQGKLFEDSVPDCDILLNGCGQHLKMSTTHVWLHKVTISSKESNFQCKHFLPVTFQILSCEHYGKEFEQVWFEIDQNFSMNWNKYKIIKRQIDGQIDSTMIDNKIEKRS